MNQQSLIDYFNPSDFGLKELKTKKGETTKRQTRKNYPNDDYITKGNGKRSKTEISITTKCAEDIFNYYGTKRFDYAMDEHSGALFFIPNPCGKIELYKSGNSSHYMFSISAIRDDLIEVFGDFRRLFVVIALNTNHLLVVPDRKNENNEYVK